MEHVRNHYNKQEIKDFKERKDTANINIQNINNKIKYTLIEDFLERGSTVLDLACGKGGDLRKYTKKEVTFLYGLDCSNISLLEILNRVKKFRPDFPCRFKIQDCFGEKFDLEKHFDFISCQFSFHYSFYKEEIAKQAIENVAIHLKPGGKFIMTIPSKNVICERIRKNNLKNTLYHIKPSSKLMECAKNNQTNSEDVFGLGYSFMLSDSINECEEWVVDDKYIVDEFKKYGCNVILNASFGQYCIDMKKQRRTNIILHDEYLQMKPDEREVVDIYQIYVFTKEENICQ